MKADAAGFKTNPRLTAKPLETHRRFPLIQRCRLNWRIRLRCTFTNPKHFTACAHLPTHQIQSWKPEGTMWENDIPERPHASSETTGPETKKEEQFIKAKKKDACPNLWRRDRPGGNSEGHFPYPKSGHIEPGESGLPKDSPAAWCIRSGPTRFTKVTEKTHNIVSFNNFITETKNIYSG